MWPRKVRYCLYMNPSLVTVLSLIKPILNLTPANIILPFMLMSSKKLFKGRGKTWTPLDYRARATIFPLILNKPRFSKFVNFVVDDMNIKLFWDMNSVIVR